MKKPLVGLLVSLVAATTFSGNKCYWIPDSGSGSLTDPTHWVNGLAPKSNNDDTLYITNNVEGTVITVDDGGIVLNNVMVGKSAYPIHFTGGKIAFGGSIRYDVPVTVDNDLELKNTNSSLTPGHTVNEAGPSVFNGAITLQARNPLYIGGYHEKIFNGPITGLGAVVRPMLGSSSRPYAFNEPVQVKELDFYADGNSSGSEPYFFNAPSNQWEVGRLYNRQIHFGCANAMTTNAPFAWHSFPGSNESSSSYCLDGYDQIGNRIDGVRTGSALNYDNCYISTTNACSLLLRGTADASTDCRTKGELTLIWAPTGDFTQMFSNRTHYTTGLLVVSNGTFCVGTGSSFASVPRIEVRGGRFLVTSAVSGALSGVQIVRIEDGALFEFGAEAAPFTSGQVHMTVATGGRFKLPGGKTLTLASLKIGDELLAAGDYTGEGGAEGTVLPQLTGTGKVTVLGAIPVTGVTKTWNGGSGKWSEPSNWAGGVVPVSGDKVVLSASANGAVIENDLTGLCLEKLSFTGSHAFGLSGNQIGLLEGSAFENTTANVWTTNGLDMVLMTAKEYVFHQPYGTGPKCVFGGVISGPGRLKCQDAGVWYWLRANTFTGGLTITSGQHHPFDARAFGACRTVTTYDTTIRPHQDGTFYDYDFIVTGGNFTVDFLEANNCSVGAITNNGKGTIWARVGESKAYTGTVRGEIYSPNGNLDANTHKQNGVVHFAGRLNVKKITSDVGGSAGPGLHCFDAAGNVYSDIQIGWNAFRCGTKDALCATAPVSFAGFCGGWNESSTAYVDLNGFDQTVDRVRNDPSNPGWRPRTDYYGRRFLTAADKPATLMQRATADAKTEARFDGPITVVWNAVSSSSVWELTNHLHSLSGALVASNGIIRVCEGVAMSSLPTLVVGPQGEMVLATTVEKAFYGVRRIELAPGGKLTFGPEAFASLPTDGSLTVALGTGSRLTLPAGSTLRAGELTLDGVPCAKNRRYSTGDISEIVGGSVFVTVGAVTPVPVTWTGAGGADTSAGTAANWGGALPDMTAATLAATFASGGTAATLPANADYSWHSIAFAGAAASDFELAAQPGAKLMLGAGGLTQGESLTNVVSAPLMLGDRLTVETGAKSRLELRGGLTSPNGAVNVAKEGKGTLALYGENDILGSFAVSNGEVEVWGTTNTLGGAAAEGEVFVRQTVNNARLSFKTSGVIERKIVTECVNEGGALYFAPGITNVFTKEVRSRNGGGGGVPRYSFGNASCTILEGGADFRSGWFCPAPSGNAEMICRKEPVLFSYLYMAIGFRMRLQSEKNTAGTIEFPEKSTSVLSVETDGAFDSVPALRFYASVTGGIELNGHDVTFGSMPRSLGGYIASRDMPATVGFDFSDVNCTNENVRILGELSIRKLGTKSLTLLPPVEATGALEVAGGEVACGPSFRWRNCTNVTVAANAKLSFAASPAMRNSWGVRMALDETSRVDLGNGARLRVKKLMVGGEPVADGIYGGTDCTEKGVLRLDQLTGTGTLTVGETGLMLILR